VLNLSPYKIGAFEAKGWRVEEKKTPSKFQYITKLGAFVGVQPGGLSIMAGGEENYTRKSPHWVRISLNIMEIILRNWMLCQF
jgi:hypothetical protein